MRPLWLAAALLGSGVNAGRAQEPALSVALNRNQIYLGESVLLTVQIDGADQASPDLSAITNATINSRGSQGGSSFNITMINGQFHQERKVSRTFTYELTPASAGDFRAGPIKVNISGKTLTNPGQLVRVSGMEQQDRVRVHLSASREALLVDEPFDLTLAIWIRRMDGQFAAYDPILPGDPPQLQIPYLDGNPIDGMDSPDIKQVLDTLLIKQQDRAGFTINQYSIQGDPFRDFFNMGNFNPQQPAKFMFEKGAGVTNGLPYVVYTLTLRYTPRAEGNYTFGPVVFKGRAVEQVNEQGQASARPVFAVGPAFTVRVVPPPEQGRPDTFIGAIGTNLEVTAALDTQTCKVGDPLTLTVRVSGNANLNMLRPLPLAASPALLQDFRLYSDTVQSQKKDNAYVFSYTLRPLHEGTLEIPPLEAAFYNTARAAYQTVKTIPIPLRVNPAMEMAESMMIRTVTNTAETAAAVRRVPVAPIMADADGTSTAPLFNRPVDLPLLLAGPLIYGLTLGLRAWARSRQARHTANIRGKALKHALQGLKAAERTAHRDPMAATPLIGRALRLYLSHRFDIPEASLTPQEAGQHLRRNGIPPETAAIFVKALETCFNAAYTKAGQPAPAAPHDFAALRHLLETIEKQNSAASGKGAGTLMLFILLLSAGQAKAEPSFFRWEEAQSRMATARSASDFRDTASVYHALIEEGARNGTLFYNYGTARLLAGEYDEAIQALLRAERYLGAQPDVEHNLKLAFARGETDPAGSLPWYRPLLFAHYQISLPARTTFCALFFTLFWLALLLRRYRPGDIAGTMLGMAAAGLIFFSTSIASSWLREKQDIDHPWAHLPASAATPAPEGP
jgi:tetratricopeptide (TPR) repeat protein